MSEWISVEQELPKSGEHVLLCCEVRCVGGGIGKYVCDGFWAERYKHETSGFPDECACEYSEENDEYYLLEGWHEVIKNWDDYNSVVIGDFVTHWMPLPSPPDETVSAADADRLTADEMTALARAAIGGGLL